MKSIENSSITRSFKYLEIAAVIADFCSDAVCDYFSIRTQTPQLIYQSPKQVKPSVSAFHLFLEVPVFVISYMGAHHSTVTQTHISAYQVAVKTKAQENNSSFENSLIHKNIKIKTFMSKCCTLPFIFSKPLKIAGYIL